MRHPGLVLVSSLWAIGCGAGERTAGGETVLVREPHDPNDVPSDHAVPAPAIALPAVAPLEAGQRFAEAGFRGSAAVWRHDTLHCDRCEDRFCPASTFKVPNALIAIDLELATPERSMAWDGVDHSIAAWNREHTLRSAIAHSVVWYFQALAREIGTERYESYLHRFRYGNERIGDSVDEFWLDDSLQISPREQVRWWHDLHAGSLGVRPDATRDVLAMTVLAEDEQATLRGKTGWRNEVPVGGWFVGSLSTHGPDAELVTFAVHLEADEGYDRERFIGARRQVAEAILRDLGLHVPATGPQ